MAERHASAEAGESLVCPRCGARRPPTERFCERCRLPLVLDGGAILEPLSPSHARHRQIKPQLSEGELVKVAFVRNQAEGELVQDLLLQEGVPSMLRRSAGFDVPDFLAAGPRDVMVPASGAPTAREILLEAELITGDQDAFGRGPRPLRLLAGLIAALALGTLVILLLWLAIR